MKWQAKKADQVLIAAKPTADKPVVKIADPIEAAALRPSAPPIDGQIIDPSPGIDTILTVPGSAENQLVPAIEKSVLVEMTGALDGKEPLRIRKVTRWSFALWLKALLIVFVLALLILALGETLGGVGKVLILFGHGVIYFGKVLFLITTKIIHVIGWA